MENVKDLFKAYNRDLQFRLIPMHSEPIYCNSVTDVNDEIFNKPLKDIENEKHI